MTKTKADFSSRVHIAAILFFGVSGTAALAQNGTIRYPVTPEMVIAAMQSRQLQTSGVEVRLSAPISSTSSNPLLDIQEIKLAGELSAQLRIACRTPHACLPFYVSVTWAKGATSDAATSALGHLDLRAHANVAAPHSPEISRGEESLAPATLHTGAAATLLIEDQKVHIRMKVICMEDGGPGKTIRVATLDHKQSYKAEIIAPDLLKGSF